MNRRVIVLACCLAALFAVLWRQAPARADIGTPADDLRRQVHTITGDICIYPRFHSRFLPQDRDVLVWLPQGYDVNRSRRYSVLYMHDGQNVFDGGTATFVGHEWRADETATELIAARRIEPLIIVAIDHSKDNRTSDYTPTTVKSDPWGLEGGGQADQYGRFLVEELKPFIDSHYRTKTDAADTAIGGSSLGGLVSLYVGLKYPDVYGKIACFSTAAWWDNDWIAGYVRRLPSKTNQRIWQDVGTDEEYSPTIPKVALPSNRTLSEALLAKGWREGVDYRYLEAEGARHSEDAWALRFGPMLEFMFPAREARSKQISKEKLH